VQFANNVDGSLGKHHDMRLSILHVFAGICHRAFTRSNSRPRASTIWLTLLAVKIANSNVLALVLVRVRKHAMSGGSSR
jgi:hypothetical protein